MKLNTNNPMKTLFDQLGLDSEDHAIEKFILNNQLPRNLAIEKAPCWKTHQAEFLIAAKADNAEWSDVVDDLDTLLHKDSMK